MTSPYLPPFGGSVSISVPEYLQRWTLGKFSVHPVSGGILIPSGLDLYYCVWRVMSRWPMEQWAVGVKRPVPAPEGNLKIHLPCRRHGAGKDPRVFCYISERGGRVVRGELKRMFDWDFHHWMEAMLGGAPGLQKKEAVRRYCKRYRLGIDSEDALLKNWQRYERGRKAFFELNKCK